MSYVDDFGLYNVKPIIAGIPSGNDGPIVTGYALKCDLPVEMHKVVEYYEKLRKNPETGIPAERLPNKSEPPVSRDTILGWWWLGLLDIETIIKADWNFSPYPLPKSNLKEALASVTSIGVARAKVWLSERTDAKILGNEEEVRRLAHRNAIWADGGLPQMWKYAFSVPIQDRAYMLREECKPVPWNYVVYEKLSRKLSNKSSNSSRLIAWKKYDELPPIEVFIEYFGVDHPITLSMKKRLSGEG